MVKAMRHVADIQNFPMFISGKFGIVHREGWCAASHGYPKIAVSRNQCLVYKLPPCTSCWTDRNQYNACIYND